MRAASIGALQLVPQSTSEAKDLEPGAISARFLLSRAGDQLGARPSSAPQNRRATNRHPEQAALRRE
jgi:hypothetical protein